MTDINASDLRDLRDAITAEMRSGFYQVNARLDMVNGKVNATAVQAARHDERLGTLEEDRDDERTTRTGRGSLLIWGGGTAGGVVAIIEAMKAWLKNP